MGGKRSRDKGHNWERETCKHLHEATGLEFQRELREVRDGNLGDIRGPLALSIQCKAGKSIRWLAALEEAEESAAPGDASMAWIRVDGSSKGGVRSREVVLMDISLAKRLIAIATAAGEFDNE